MSKKDTSHKKYSRALKTTAGWVLTLGIIGSIVYFVVTAPRVPTTDLASTSGLHYHPKLSIMVNGVPMTIPSKIGLGAVESPIHTHDEGDGTLHLEFAGHVKKTDITLGKFFDVWGKDWTATSFMGLPIDATHHLTMKVDGVESTEYRDLIMADKQQIELIYQ